MIFRMPPPAFCPKVLPRWTKRAILWAQAPHKVRPREVAAIEIFWIFLISFAVVGLLVYQLYLHDYFVRHVDTPAT